MKPSTDEAKELLELAERDRLAFEALVASKDIHISMPLFHAQQYVEKVMKAMLVTQGAIFRRTHDLLELAELLQQPSRVGTFFVPTRKLSR
ncbi:MAG: HEPN domain-containing protein [Sulfuricellaceae bacterium]